MKTNLLFLCVVFASSLSAACGLIEGGTGDETTDQQDVGRPSSDAPDSGVVSTANALCAQARDHLYTQPCATPLTPERYCEIFDSLVQLPGCRSVIESFHQCTIQSTQLCCGSVYSGGECGPSLDNFNVLLPADCVGIFEENVICTPSFSGGDGGVFELDAGSNPEDLCTSALDNLLSIECESPLSDDEYRSFVCPVVRPACETALTAFQRCAATSDVICASSNVGSLAVPADCDAELDALAACQDG